jgi:hypothetical protein
MTARSNLWFHGLLRHPGQPGIAQFQYIWHGHTLQITVLAFASLFQFGLDVLEATGAFGTGAL